MEQVYAKYRDRAAFFVMYAWEQHPLSDGASLDNKVYSQHKSYEQKCFFAKLTRKKLDITVPILVEGLDGKVQRAYGAAPNMVYVVDTEGKIAFGARWTRANEIEKALEKMLEGSSDKEVVNDKSKKDKDAAQEGEEGKVDG